MNCSSDDEHSYHGEDRWSDSDEEFADADLEILKETPRLPSSLSSPSSVGDQLSSPSSVGDQHATEAFDAAVDAAVSKAATEVKAAADAKTAAQAKAAAAEDVSVQHVAFPVITELDKMDEDQSSPNLDMVMLDQDLNNNLPGQSHSTTPGPPATLCPPGPPAMRERGSWWPAGWYPDNWFSSSSSQPMSPPRTGGTGRRIRKASGPYSPDLNRFSSSPNMFCTVNC